MEDSKSEESKAFIKAEMDITKPYLEKSPFRNELTARYKELYDHPKFVGLYPHGNKFFSYQNTGLQKQEWVTILFLSLGFSLNWIKVDGINTVNKLILIPVCSTYTIHSPMTARYLLIQMHPMKTAPLFCTSSVFLMMDQTSLIRLVIILNRKSFVSNMWTMVNICFVYFIFMHLKFKMSCCSLLLCLFFFLFFLFFLF